MKGRQQRENTIFKKDERVKGRRKEKKKVYRAINRSGKLMELQKIDKEEGKNEPNREDKQLQ